ncbi:MAG: 4-alpha-glucanotransferase, partial [Clostridiales bacterium]|nr:4-alpha-glucanotransferase [Clostridiales bacterium]
QVFVQYLFFRQWNQLKQYANARGILLFGDMPIYVALDSADCWASPDYFQLDRTLHPTHVAGVPPDYFTQDGQLWGNPLYNWKALKKDGYRWWLKRLAAMASFFDLLRIDHFIGFANYYAVRAGARNARYGNWHIGPGRDFFRIVKRELPTLRIIAEDLGVVNPRVKKLLRYCGYPGMKVLTFAFGDDMTNQHLPGNIPVRCAYYTGTHDNDTVLGWWQKADKQEKALAVRVLALENESQLCDTMIRAVFGSVAQYAIVPMQDILQLGQSARMNTPGTLGGNWLWRMPDGALTKALQSRLATINKAYERTNT